MRSDVNLRLGTIAQLLALWADTDGVILPYVTMMLVVIIGISVLALDGARCMYLQTQLQNGAEPVTRLTGPSSEMSAVR